MLNKNFIVPALALLAMASCQKTGVETPEMIAASQRPIDFTTYTGRAITKADNLEQSINVTAYQAGTHSQQFPSTTYNYSSGSFIGEETRYWPEDTGTNLDFYAVSPIQYVNQDSTAVDLPVASDSTFTVTKTDGTTDIVAARAMNAPNGAVPDPVELGFKHKLTRVKFTAIGADQSKKYVITDIVLTANSSAKYQFGESESWTAATDEYDYHFIPNAADSVTIDASTSSPVAAGAAKYLIPTQASELTAVIYYKVYSGDVMFEDRTVSGATVKLSTDVWGINKSVVYALSITPKRVVTIGTVTVDNWDADETEDVDVPTTAFSVSTTKMVEFTKGNLYWDGSAWAMEAKQYDYRQKNGVPDDGAVIGGVSGTTPAGTVGVFFWNNDQTKACAATYTANPEGADDYFFCDEAHSLTIGDKSGLYTLSKDEYDYLIRIRPNAANLCKYGVTVCGQANCLIIAPDKYDFSTTPIAASYDATEWAAAEAAGLVCIPSSGFANGDSSVSSHGVNGLIWTSTRIDALKAYDLYFDSSNVSGAATNYCQHAFAIRLVYTVE